ncbi:MAG: HAD-IIA family hydrolase [Verrucomicrobiales bacterium]
MAGTAERLRQLRHVALDMDGTIYHGGQLFDTTLPFLELLREQGIGYSFVTNNCSRSRAQYVAHLQEMGIDTSLEQLLTSADATIAYLKCEQPAIRSIYLIGTESLRAEFAAAGFKVASNDDDPDAVVVGFDTALRYENLCRASYWVREGKPFFATHPDMFCPSDAPLVLVDCGAVCACIQSATGRAPEAVLGKPDPRMLAPVLQRYELTADQVAMVGDRLYTDMAMAARAGAFGVFVQTGDGKTGAGDADAPAPDLVVPGLAEFGAALVAAWCT